VPKEGPDPSLLQEMNPVWASLRCKDHKLRHVGSMWKWCWLVWRAVAWARGGFYGRIWRD